MAATISGAFAPDSDELYIVRQVDDKGKKDAYRLFRYGPGDVNPRSAVDVEGEAPRIVGCAKKGRIALASRFGEDWNVVDVQTGRTLLSSNSPELKASPPRFKGSFPLLLSP